MFRSEVFIFDYGICVFWNFTKNEEKKFLIYPEKFTTSPFERIFNN